MLRWRRVEDVTPDAPGGRRQVRVGAGWPRWLALFTLCLALTGCYVPLQPTPLMGEGPPPGFLTGELPQPYQGKRNPFATSDAQARAAGRALYQAYSPSCSACHGGDGRGAGPASPYLEPKPADFATGPMVAAFRDHPEYVYWWVSEGVPKTVMPAWQGRMNETQRWQVITYAQWLAEQALGRPLGSAEGKSAVAEAGRQ